jgi:hypothetical protein
MSLSIKTPTVGRQSSVTSQPNKKPSTTLIFQMIQRQKLCLALRCIINSIGITHFFLFWALLPIIVANIQHKIMEISTSQLNLVNSKLRPNHGGADEKREIHFVGAETGNVETVTHLISDRSGLSSHDMWVRPNAHNPTS